MAAFTPEDDFAVASRRFYVPRPAARDTYDGLRPGLVAAGAHDAEVTALADVRHALSTRDPRATKPGFGCLGGAAAAATATAMGTTRDTDAGEASRRALQEV